MSYIPASADAAAVIIPARFGSTRFPGKPLADATGRPLIQHVVENACRARTPIMVLTATDDERIATAVRTFGGAVVLTRADQPSGTDRVAEAAATLPANVGLIVNVQGDEPELPPSDIDRLVERLRADAAADMATLAAPFPVGESPDDPARVKVVVSRTGRALYFSRSRIPHYREPPDEGSPCYLLHLGVYAYRRSFLARLSQLAPTPLEQAEKLEQLRVLEHGFTIAVELAVQATAGIDTPDDYQRFLRRWRQSQGELQNRDSAQAGGSLTEAGSAA